SHARQPEGTALEPPSSSAFAQLQCIDALQAEITATQDSQWVGPSESGQRQFVHVTCRLNGGTIPLDLDVLELRRAVGLPLYDLFPPFRPNLDSTTPADNVADEDHAMSMAN
ncbi:hypothetical protein PHMEG_00038323, partial [Phytophthora megakarya]